MTCPLDIYSIEKCPCARTKTSPQTRIEAPERNMDGWVCNYGVVRGSWGPHDEKWRPPSCTSFGNLT